MVREQRLNNILVMLLCIHSEILAKPLLEDSHINEFINSRKLREDGFNEFELTSVQEVSNSHQQSLDVSSIHRRRRSVDSTESYDIDISAFGESYKMTLQHTKSVLHPSAKVSIITDEEKTEWNGEHPECFLIGNVHSHDGTVSASFCEELRGMMSTSDHELHFEVLPHHIRKRSSLKSEQHTTLIARKRREDFMFSDFSQKNDDAHIYQTEYNHEKINKRSVPSSDLTIELAVYCDADFLSYKLPATDMTRRVEIMLCKYNAVQCEWSRAGVLNYNVTLSIKLMSFFDTNPSWYNASTSLSVPLKTICTGTQTGLAYDHVHVHTGIPNSELGGLAYQSTVCNPRYRCGVSADGITTYVATVHEIGHNMGMLHDADRNCLSPDVGLMGGAGVGWSTCSVNDMNTMLQTGNHGCLWTDNIADNEVTPASLQGLTLVPELIGQLKTADEVCEQIYGSGFRYREYPNVVDPSCNLYSCVDHNVGNTHGQMFKQSDSITGLYCEDQKICFRGGCADWSEAQLTNPEVRVGGWSDWETWTTCSRTCGRGMIYRRRICNNPTPKNSANCEGNEYEAQGCSLTPCDGDSSTDSILIIQRANETCQRLIDNNIINETEYTASGTIYSSLNHGVCEVFCESTPGYTRPDFTRFGLIENGTPCPGTLDTADANQYSRRPGFYSACLEGYCQRFDCSNTLNSGVFDGCGVCNGDNSTCLIREGTFTDDVAQWTRIEWTQIPVGAYNIEISFVWNDMKQYYTEIFTEEGDPIITSSIGGDSRIFQTKDSPVSYGGTLWHNDAYVAIMHAEGPLTHPVIVKVYSFASNSNTGMKYVYSVPITTTTDSVTTNKMTTAALTTTPMTTTTVKTTETATVAIATNDGEDSTQAHMTFATEPIETTTIEKINDVTTVEATNTNATTETTLTFNSTTDSVTTNKMTTAALTTTPMTTTTVKTTETATVAIATNDGEDSTQAHMTFATEPIETTTMEKINDVTTVEATNTNATTETTLTFNLIYVYAFSGFLVLVVLITIVVLIIYRKKMKNAVRTITVKSLHNDMKDPFFIKRK
ncbi:A disintegrin and metalloproteinase with thrombospondin motifs 1-like isoform X1 [Mytilus californianus]|uniref:A disintegrin and metalloproteinase with thrombospondin motifs 1-like isoform X1 n=1 Tax=Mytilus californianus TaxID=6549 RepID=UPI002246764F|nr:A disintegrin and metalloproteinase with thrombospondin motifs 1-like isoform X1 [Mytilus californianus]